MSEKKYRIVRADFITDLERQVNHLEEEGYKCVGGITIETHIMITGPKSEYFQAMEYSKRTS